MAKIKICGLRSPDDIQLVNEYMPDYAGFIVDFPKSFRSLTIEQLEKLTVLLDSKIVSVGVFVDEDREVIRDLLQRKVIQMAQLHGHESEGDIQYLKQFGPIIKAFEIHGDSDIQRARASSADYILLDSGKGSGKTFDWRRIQSIGRDFFLAGGINPDNIKAAIGQYHPFAVDVSSGVETNKKKDREKVKLCIEKGKEYE